MPLSFVELFKLKETYLEKQGKNRFYRYSNAGLFVAEGLDGIKLCRPSCREEAKDHTHGG